MQVESCLCSCRLFSSAVFNDTFAAHTPPEILNTPLEGVVLLMKAMQIEQVTFTQHNFFCKCIAACLFSLRRRA